MAAPPDDASIPHVFGIALFEGFETIDVMGTAEVIENLLNGNYHVELYLLGETLGPVSNKPTFDTSIIPHNSSVFQTVLPSYTFANPPDNLEVLIVPGGFGTFYPGNINATVHFVRDIYPKLKYLITVCTGAMVAAEAGLLDGKRATTNKPEWVEATASGPNTTWVAPARWVVDGNIWTTSGNSAGMDGVFGFVDCLYGTQLADAMSDDMEYQRHPDPSWDPYAKIFNVTGSS
jgi:transcriptional regulator GlxA family with amidase domain